MNKVFLIGRLTRDPELRYTSGNVPVATFSIAVNRTFANANGEREADFFNIVVWRKQAENVSQFVKKGSQVAIDGRLQSRSYDDANGQKRYVTEVVADNVQFLDSKKDSESMASSNAGPTPYDFPEESAPTNDVKADPFADFGNSIEINDDELPF